MMLDSGARGSKEQIRQFTFNYNTHRAKELLQLFLEYPDIHFHLEIHPALLSDDPLLVDRGSVGRDSLVA